MMDFYVKRMSPEKAIELLKKDGIIVNCRQAEIILDFLYEMAEITVDQYLSDSL